jgi:hypothetical protein
MRKILAAGAAFLVCVLPAGLTATAQSQSPAPPDEWAAVTATATCSLKTAGTRPGTPPPYVLSGQVVECVTTASDPRVTGSSTFVLYASSWAGPGHTGVAWGEYMVQGPDGTWTGRHSIVYDATGVAHALTVASGDGAYDGWTYATSTTVSVTGTLDIVGVIYPGAPPPGFPVSPFPTPAPSAAP